MQNMTHFSLRLADLRSRISAACHEFGRNPEEITLLAVSKRHPADAIREAAAAGLHYVGENFVQEAIGKMDQTADLDLVWHFIGHLQSNKTRIVAERFQWVQSLDRVRIARRLNAQRPFHAPPMDVCIQVCLESEPGKGGVMPSGLATLAKEITELDRLRLRGLMAIPPPSDDFDVQRGYFRHLRALRDELVAGGLQLDTLSMGMSADLEAAIAEGATMLRVGTALFGPRPGTGA
jgi:pyridoxal phosphate enzyme (YggS family)